MKLCKILKSLLVQQKLLQRKVYSFWRRTFAKGVWKICKIRAGGHMVQLQQSSKNGTMLQHFSICIPLQFYEVSRPFSIMISRWIYEILNSGSLNITIECRISTYFKNGLKRLLLKNKFCQFALLISPA